MIQTLQNGRLLSYLQGAAFQKKRYDKELLKINNLDGLIASGQTDQFIKRSDRVTFGSRESAEVLPKQKLERMAKQLAKHNLDAYYLSPEDEHLNEYLPENKQRITWLTGFTGENASLLVTPDAMHIYVDGRFHIQVDDEVDRTVIEPHKLGLTESAQKEVSNTIKQLAGKKPKGKFLRVGYDPFIVSPQRLRDLESNISKQLKVKLEPLTGNLVDQVWSKRPHGSDAQAFEIDESITGKNLSAKLKAVRSRMKELEVDIFPLTRLDEIAWLFNIRGKDVPFNPVVESYAVLTDKKAYLFVYPNKITAELKKSLKDQGVIVKPYSAYQKIVTDLVNQSDKKPGVLIDKNGVTQGTVNLVKQNARIVETDSPVKLQKAIKNNVELEKMGLANFKASRAIIRHMAAVEKDFSGGKYLNEVTLRNDLETKYKEEQDFYDLSFQTIPGVGSNSAIIHYSKADPKQKAQKGLFYLLDSGAQYIGGTTDTTRTTVFGEPSKAQIEKYTSVLKGHIACASMCFPENTNGIQMDAVCRDKLWRNLIDFNHGTGHGVGAFINVHEGPNRISQFGKVAFEPGMVTSIEPGYYKKDWGGIRLESLYYVKEYEMQPPASLDPETKNPKWYRFEHLTFVPFEKKLIDFSVLTAEEKAWLKDYYRQIWEKMSPDLNSNEKAWLKDQITLPE